MPKGEQRGSIGVHGGKLRLTYYVSGRRVRESTNLLPTPAGMKAARTILRRRLAEIETGAYVQRDAGVTFDDCADAWIESLRSSNSRDGSPYKPSSVTRYERLLKRWRMRLGSKALASLRPEDVSAACQSVMSGVSNATAVSLAVVCRKMLRYAEAEHKLEHKPSTFKGAPEKARTRKLLPEDVWPLEKVSKLVECASSIDRTFGHVVRLGLLTGMRNGEIRALRLEDIDMVGKVIRVRRTAAEDGADGDPFGPPKTARSVRDLDVDDQVMAVLRERVAMVLGKSQWLFPSHLDADMPMPYWRLSAWHKRLKKEMGIDLPPHRLRHTFASTALAKGASISEVAAYMGDTQATVERYYATWADPAARRRAASLFGSMYDSCPIRAQEVASKL